MSVIGALKTSGVPKFSALQGDSGEKATVGEVLDGIKELVAMGIGMDPEGAKKGYEEMRAEDFEKFATGLIAEAEKEVEQLPPEEKMKVLHEVLMGMGLAIGIAAATTGFLLNSSGSEAPTQPAKS